MDKHSTERKLNKDRKGGKDMFQTPDIKVIRFAIEDVITTSTGGSIGGNGSAGGGDEED